MVQQQLIKKIVPNYQFRKKSICLSTAVIQTGASATMKLKSQTCVWQKRVIYELKTET